MFGSFQSLQQRSFAFLWSGQAVSALGDNLHQIALAWWVLEKTGSATAMGKVLAFAFTPMLIFLLVGGVVADKFSRLRLMLFSDLVRALVVGTVAYFAHRHTLQIWHIYIAALIFGFVDAFFRPAYSALVPEIVAEQNLPSANSLTELSKEFTNIVGPLVGASLIAWGGTAFAIALDACSFIFSALCLLFVTEIPKSKTPSSNSQSSLQSFREGWQVVAGSVYLWLTILLFSLVNVAISGSYRVALPFYVKTNLLGNVKALGWLYTATSVGAVFAAIWWGRHKQLRRRGLWSYIMTGLMGLMMILAALTHAVWFAIFAMIVFGFVKMSFGLFWTSSLQSLVAKEKLGRVISIDCLGSFALLPMGYALAGWGSDTFGPSIFMIFSGVLTIGVIAVGLLHPQIRNFD